MASAVSLRTRSSISKMEKSTPAADFSQRTPPKKKKYNEPKPQMNDSTKLATGSTEAAAEATTGEGSENAESKGDADGEDDHPDASAPSSRNHHGKPLSATLKGSKGSHLATDATAGTGQHPSGHFEDQNDTVMGEDEPLPLVEDVGNYDLNGDFSDMESVNDDGPDSMNASDVERDDDYGALDAMSDTSDGSNADEREFEQEVQELEDHGGIDWDDPWSMQYNPDFRTGEYDICGEDGSLQSINQIHADQEQLEDLDATIASLYDTNFTFDLNRRHSGQSDSGSSITSSAPTTPLTPYPSHRPSVDDTPVTDAMPSPTILDEGDETDDEDFGSAYVKPEPKRKTGKSGNQSIQRNFTVLDATYSPSKTFTMGLNPVMGRFTIDGLQAYSYHDTDTRGRRVLVHIPPGAEVDAHGIIDPMPRSRSLSLSTEHPSWESEDSGLDSPTFIDWNDAAVSGNTNSGAAITDAIRGSIFAQAHCRSRRHLDEALEVVPSFLQRLQSIPDAMMGDDLYDYQELPVSANEPKFDDLIDVDECAAPATPEPRKPRTFTRADMLYEAQMLDAPTSAALAREGYLPALGTNPFGSMDELAISPDAAFLYNTPYNPMLQDMTTPPQTPTTMSQSLQHLSPPTSSISPKKRRLSERSNSNLASSVLKRSRTLKREESSPLPASVANGDVSMRDTPFVAIPQALMVSSP